MIYVAAVLLVLLAVLFSIARLILDDMGKYRDIVEQQVSQLLNQRVHIEGFDARLEGMTPVLIFKGVKLLNSGNNKELARFAEARVGVAVLASLRERQLVPGEITISGIHVILTRHKSGSLSVQGLKVSQLEGADQATADTQLSHWLFTYSALNLEDSSIVWQDNMRGKRVYFSDVNLHLMNRGRRHILSGQLEVPKALGRGVKFSADIDGDSMKPQDWRGNFFMQAFAVDIKQWQQFQPDWNNAQVKNGQLDVRLWGSWQHNRLVSLAGDLSVYNLLLQEKTSAPIEFKLIAGMFDWQRRDQDWSVKVKDLQLIQQSQIWPKTDVEVFYKSGAEDVYQIRAGYLRIEDVHRLLSSFTDASDKWRQVLDGVQPSGDIKGLQAEVFLQSNNVRDFVVRTKFNHLSTSAWQHYPAVQGFQGELTSTLNYGKLKIENQFSTLYLPNLFRRAFSLQALKTTVVWSKTADGWLVSADDVQASTAEVKTQSGLYLYLPANKSSPYMDLQVQFWDGNAAQAKAYYPVGIMGKGLVRWLDQGIVAGKVSFGGAVFSGRLRDFPFRQKQGAFQVQFYADDVELDYQTHWPRLTNAKVDASFTGMGMHIKGIQAKLLQQTSSEDVDVSIKDFLQPELRVRTTTSGPTKEVFDFLVNSPIAPQARTVVDSVVMRGRSNLNLELYVPLNKKMAALKPLHYRGKAKLQQSSFMLLDKALDIGDVNGVLGFDETGLTAKGIKARILGEAATLDVYTQKYQDAWPIQVVAEGKVDAATLAGRFDLPGLDKISGKTAWQGVFTLPYVQQGKPQPAKLSLTSDLHNIAIALPKPLLKVADDTAAFAMGVEFSTEARTNMSFQYKDQLRAVVALDSQKGKNRIVKAAINFGETMPRVPKRKQLKLYGNAVDLPVQPWAKVFADHKTSKRQSAFDWRQMPVELAMEGLQLRFEEGEGNKDSSAAAIQPQQWPLMNGYINHLMVNNTVLGRLELAAEREQYGFNIKQLDLITPFSKVTASGIWSYHRQNETRLNLDMTSSNLGAQLSQWGFSAIIKAGKVDKTHMQVSWDDSPFGFEFAKLKGSMDAYIKDGNITEVDAGAGRLFGLLSLSALPRRLFLDFADLKSGFSFDSVQGTFAIGDGNATTKNLSVDSTLAKVVVDGRTGLSAQDYDLNVLVIPNISGTAPLPGYLVWGPQVGAVLLFFKQLFGSAFDKSVATSYRITGSWEKPVIEKVANPATAAKE